jgi:hypothetical protein
MAIGFWNSTGVVLHSITNYKTCCDSSRIADYQGRLWNG